MCIHVHDGYRDNSVKILIDRYRMLVSEMTVWESLTHVSVPVCISRIQMRIMLSFIMTWSWKKSVVEVYIMAFKYP